mgnify:CR=1 FL=1
MKKSKGMAIASFIFGLTFWIPLLNLIFGALALYLGFKALNRIKGEHNKYGGKIFAIIGITLAAIVYITYITGLGICLSGNKAICSFIGLQQLVWK